MTEASQEVENRSRISLNVIKKRRCQRNERTAYHKDVEKIEQEIEHRKLVVRKEAIEADKEARAQGDLSENFEYYAAKKHKNQNESRIRYLERMLKTASIVSDASRSDEVGMDDIVEVLFEEDNEVEKYKLVTSIRGNSMENRISIESPIGKALRGHRVGDRVEVKVNDDYSYYLVIRIRGSPHPQIRSCRWIFLQGNNCNHH